MRIEVFKILRQCLGTPGSVCDIDYSVCPGSHYSFKTILVTPAQVLTQLKFWQRVKGGTKRVWTFCFPTGSGRVSCIKYKKNQTGSYEIY